MGSRWLRPVLLLLVIALAVWAFKGPTPQGAAVPVAASSPAPITTSTQAADTPHTEARSTRPSFLPPEAHRTIVLIQRGGPFPHRQDGSVFGNREGHLPSQPRGWYHEYTVDTPGLNHRGARRIVTGGTPPSLWYYSDDHYRSFRSFEVSEDLP